MASYCQEKFENESGEEKLVCWRQDKHEHNTAMIGEIQKWLAEKFGGTWQVRANSYQSNLQSCNPKAVDYDEK